MTHHSDTDQRAGWRRCSPGLDRDRNISSRGKGDHSEQVAIDLYRSFQIKVQAGANHAGKITFAALKSHQIPYGSRVNIFPLICHMCFSLKKRKKVLSNMIWFKNVRRRSLSIKHLTHSCCGGDFIWSNVHIYFLSCPRQAQIPKRIFSHLFLLFFPWYYFSFFLSLSLPPKPQSHADWVADQFKQQGFRQLNVG